MIPLILTEPVTFNPPFAFVLPVTVNLSLIVVALYNVVSPVTFNDEPKLVIPETEVVPVTVKLLLIVVEPSTVTLPFI